MIFHKIKIENSQNRTDVSMINMLVIFKNEIKVGNAESFPKPRVSQRFGANIFKYFNKYKWLIFVYKSNGNKMNKKNVRPKRIRNVHVFY